MNPYNLLESRDQTCIILHNEEILFESTKRGVAPMIVFYQTYGNQYTNLVVIDKIMGRGAILLAKLIGASKVITPIVSTPAKELAEYYKLEVDYQTEVPYIENRAKDGQCPIETSVLNITDVTIGYQTILDTLTSLQ